MKTALTLLFSTFAFLFQATAQKSVERRICSSHEHLQQQLARNPAMKANRQSLELFTKQYAQAHPGNYLQRGAPTYVIPVVFHVVYKTAAENISEAQILSQLNILNQDFQKLNADTNLVPAAFRSVYADCKIQFCLAQRDPSGNATTGITRRQTTVASWTDDDKIKSASSGGTTAWNAMKYMNIWIGNLSNGLLGYAQFPGGPAATDGVVIGYTATGNTGTAAAPFNKGRTATHEVGHFLNLYHIWGDDEGACTGSDEVGDTPNQADANSGCPSFPKLSCNNGPNGEMFMNYMDYTNDACMMMFSNGQRTRMYATLQAGGARNSLVNSNGCVPVTTPVCATPSGLLSGNITTNKADLVWNRVASAQSYIVYYKTAAATAYTALRNISDTFITLTGLSAGTTYNYQVRTRCGATDSSAATTVASFTTTVPIVCNAPTLEAATKVSSGGARISWRKAANATGYLVYYKKSSAAAYTVLSGISDTAYTFTGLSANTGYTYTVRSRCSATDTSVMATARTFNTLAAIACTTPVPVSVGSITTTGAQVNWRKTAGAAGYFVYYKPASAATFTRLSVVDSFAVLTGLSAGTNYQWQVASRCSSSDTSLPSALSSFTTTAAPTCTDRFESNNTLATAKAITLNADQTALIGSATDQDYYSFTTTAAARNLKITMTGLPADYDLRLLNASGTQLRISENEDNLPETIIYNTTAAGTYRLHVYGYDGAFSASRCYTLKVTASSATQSRLAGEPESVRTAKAKTAISISPQPASSVARITTKGVLNGRFTLNIVNGNGHTMQTQTVVLEGGSASIDVSRLPAGLYFVQLVDGNQQYSERLLIQR